MLDGLAVRTRHSRYLLTEESSSLIHLCLISASLTAVLSFPSHTFTEMTVKPAANITHSDKTRKNIRINVDVFENY
jgi:hypothetical protein